MDGKIEKLRARWNEISDEAFEQMFIREGQSELVTLTEREDVAVELGRKMTAFLLEEQVALDAAADPKQSQTVCCPKCAQPGEQIADRDKESRSVTTRAGAITLHRRAWRCRRCRILFFSAR